MITLILVFGLVFVVTAAPTEDGQATIFNYENESDGKGNYKFGFKTSNGISREESGTVINEGTPDQYIYVYGTVSYIDIEGHKVSYRYAADQNGYEILPPLLDDAAGVNRAELPHVVASLLG